MTEQQTPPQEAGFFTTIRGWGITRGDERVLGGVASGLAERLGWRLGWTRVGVLAVVIFVSGFGALAYAAAWALLPDRQGRIVAQDFGRGVPNVGALIMIGIIAIAGLIGLGNADGLPFGWGGGWPFTGAWEGSGHGVFTAIAVVASILFSLAIVGGVVFLIIWLVRRNREATPPGAPTPGAPSPTGSGPLYAAPPAWAAARQQQRAQAVAEAQAAGASAADAARAAGVATAAAASSAGQAAADAADRAAAAATAAIPTWTATPPTPRPPRVPGPGAGFYLLTLAWLVLSAAGTAWAGWTDRLAVHPLLAWFALFVTGLGVILALVALTGRKLGFLAFMSAVLLIPTAVLIVQADKVVDGWGNRWLPRVSVERDVAGDVVRLELGDQTYWVSEQGGVTTVEPEQATPTEAPEPAFDAIGAFDAEYAAITLPASCYADGDTPSAEGSSQSLVTATDLTEDRTIDVTAAHATLRVTPGTSVEVTPTGGATAQVHWAEHGLTCELWEQEPVSLLNPDTPVLTVRVADPDRYATIVIEEVAS